MSAPKRMLSLFAATALAAWLIAGTIGSAQEKKEEEPFWAKGRPKEGGGAKMAPVAAPPVPVPADQLPELKVPVGFNVEVYQSGILDARALRRGDKGTIFVSSLFVAGKIYAVTEKDGGREVKTILSGLELPSGIEFRNGALFVATPKKIIRYDNIEDSLEKPPEPVTIYDKLPGDIPHGWKFLRFGPDGKLYVPVGAPCNICEPDPEKYAQIFRVNADGSGMEVVARGVRNTVGFDFHPKTKELWFTDNQRDWLSEDFPLDELNRVTKPGKDHFGYPYCHSGTMSDPELGWGKSCADYVKPAALLGPHSAPLGMRFYTGTMFPAKYRGAIFIARHGPWNRTKKDADVAVAYLDANSRVTRVEPFLTGFVKDNQYLGRPVDLLVMPDGALLVSDDHAGAIYRVSYGAPPRPRIRETGYRQLLGLGKEELGYGLYSYVIASAHTTRTSRLLTEVFKSIPPIGETAAKTRKQLNILYVPLLRHKQAAFDKTVERLGPDYGRLGSLYSESLYDYKIARALLNQICAAPPENMRELCRTDLSSRGPFIFTYGIPVTIMEPIPPPFLFVDLSDVHPDGFPTLLAAFKEQVKREDVSDRARIDTVRLKLLNYILPAAHWIGGVKKEVREIVYEHASK